MEHKGLKVSGISFDSRKIKYGMLFALVKENNQYISDALRLGAKAVLCKKRDVNNLNKTVKNILVTDDTRLAAAKIAKDFFPYQPKYISAVTGTNGKTSVVNFLYEIWKKNNINGASFGTLGIKYKNVNKRTKLTTLDAINLHRELDNLKNKKINFLAMEASSHALEQKRMDKVKVKFALFTNLSRDHLDYHKDMKKYFSSKKRLFESLLDEKGKTYSSVEFSKWIEKKGKLGVSYETEHSHTQVQRDIVHLACFVCLNKTKARKLVNKWSLANDEYLEILEWYTPDWYNEFIQKETPWNLTYLTAILRFFS